MDKDIEQESAFGFDGTWHEFLPIALTNMLLTLVTLGIYRFWATTRERRYLWSHTRFIDDRFEWSGTGLELFFGFLAVLILIFVPLFVLQFLLQGLIVRGYVFAVVLYVILLYLFFFWLFGVAKFRTLRYRLSRSWWRGIRGGSDDQGFRYGLSYMWRTVVGAMVFALMVPWAMIRLWNKRWNAMSFGGNNFISRASLGNVFPRFLLCYGAIVVLAVLLGTTITPLMTSVATNGEQLDLGSAGFAALAFLGFYIAVPLIMLIFYIGFLREAVGGLHLSGIDFAFTGRTKHWALLYLGNFGLWLVAFIVALVPLAVFGALGQFSQIEMAGDPVAANPGAFLILIVALVISFALVGPFIRYRTWRFAVRHLQATGEIDLDKLTQSTTRAPTQGEGLLDAFDVGAI